MGTQQVRSDANRLEYSAEYLEFKKLQDAVFGKEYEYVQDKTDQEILVEALCGKYAGFPNNPSKNIEGQKC